MTRSASFPEALGGTPLYYQRVRSDRWTDKCTKIEFMVIQYIGLQVLNTSSIQSVLLRVESKNKDTLGSHRYLQLCSVEKLTHVWLLPEWQFARSMGCSITFNGKPTLRRPLRKIGRHAAHSGGDGAAQRVARGKRVIGADEISQRIERGRHRRRAIYCNFQRVLRCVQRLINTFRLACGVDFKVAERAAGTRLQHMKRTVTSPDDSVVLLTPVSPKKADTRCASWSTCPFCIGRPASVCSVNLQAPLHLPDSPCFSCGTARI